MADLVGLCADHGWPAVSYLPGGALVQRGAQCLKWRTPVKAMARLRSSAAAMTSGSRTEPPGWMAAVAPASAAAIKPSGKGKKASLQTTLPRSESPASFAFKIAICEE